MIIQVIEGLLLGQTPHNFFLTTTPSYLVESTCDMRESQHEPAIEIGEAQEAQNFSECGWGWPVTNDLDLGWIQIHIKSINDIA
jgi:hypothetical protein